MRSKSIWALTLGLLTSLMLVSGLPGLGNLGYFSALISACICFIWSPYLGVELAHILQSSHQSTWAKASKIALVIPVTLVALVCAWLVSFPAGTPTCDWVLGIAFFLLGPGITTHLFLTLGLLFGRAFPRKAAHGLVVLSQVLCIIWEGLHFYIEPAVFSYSPIFGYFAGPIYDAAVTIEVPYLLTRTVQILCLWLIVYSQSLSLQTPFSRLGIVGGATLAMVLIYSPPGWNLSGKQHVVDAALPDVFQKGNIILKTRIKNDRSRKRAVAILADAAARYAELRDFFGMEPIKPLEIYLYPSPNFQREVMGAGRVRIAKPWLNQVHISNISERAPVLKHEMAHIFGAEVATGFLGIPTTFGVLPQMALVEGLATYLEGRRGERSLKQWSAALLHLERLPRVASILGPDGYTSTYGPTAYTASGSFLEYLDSHHGRGRLLKLYKSGNFTETYGASAETLESQWRHYLKTQVDVTETLIAEAKFKYDRKPVLNRKCPVVVARLERKAGQLATKKQWEQVLNVREEVCAINPQDPIASLKRAISSGHAGQIPQALKWLDELLQRDLGGPMKARVLHAHADFTWLSGDPQNAAATYEQLLDMPLGILTHRSITVKHAACKNPEPGVGQAIRDYLLNGKISGKERREKLMAGLKNSPTEPSLLYLAGKLNLSRRNDEEAIDLLNRSLESPQHPFIRAETLRTLGIGLLRTGDAKEASLRFEEAAELLPKEREGLVAGMMDWRAWALRLLSDA